MSDALSYLMKARPDAMASYFAFLKESGKHLDPKTRAIISVITKVDNQTRAGFKQYLKRALKEGVSANEIIDALLTAFPTLGLSKIIWAMDLLLEMDLPEFQLENLGQEPEWHRICSRMELDADVTYKVHDGKGVFIYAGDEGLRVFDSQCPHQSTCMTGEKLEDYELSCPKHGWRFDLRTGHCIAKGDKPLVSLQHKIENDYLLVLW